MLVNKQAKKFLILFGSFVVLTLGLVIGWRIYYYTHLNGYPDTANFSQRINALKFEKSSHKTVLVFHKPGCSDCLSVRSTIKSELRRNEGNIQDVVINIKDPKAKQYLIKYDVTKVPTIIFLKGNQVIDSTTSTKTNEIKRVMRGEAK